MSRPIFIILALLCSVSFISANDGFYIKPEPVWVQSVQFELDAHLISKNKSNGVSYLLLDIQEKVEKEELFQHHAI